MGMGFPIPIGNPMGMGIDDTIGNGNGKEWESPCMGMEMALIPTGINSHRRMQCLAYVIVTYSLQCNDNLLHLIELLDLVTSSVL